MTANPFKSRFNNHKKSFNHTKLENETELSKYIWDLRRKDKDFTIKWSIMKRAPADTSGCQRCNLCIDAKLCLMQGDVKNQRRSSPNVGIVKSSGQANYKRTKFSVA